ncbi:hypothetical protein B296_00022887 [Ensete ventricosum]|uniref:Uncharacterized protein n=1 Tax=Ensete ventricosum TaxID=4639 RepID=A0A427A7P9_ENSVE|nr:hypothetical protein B296_00022887 [Ensete ventricosum]
MMDSTTWLSRLSKISYCCPQVVAMLFVGMAGHFGLGNSNSLATIDVAGAFIVISLYRAVEISKIIAQSVYPLLYPLIVLLLTAVSFTVGHLKPFNCPFRDSDVHYYPCLTYVVFSEHADIHFFKGYEWPISK